MDYTYLLLLVALLISGAAQLFIKARYNAYSKINNKKGLSGVEVAQEILKKHGMDNVYVVETKGYLSDHFDPKSNVVRLSTAVFHGETISSASIAAHEVGHAIQHKEGYAMMRVRSAIVPAVNLSSKLGYLAIIIGAAAQVTDLIYIGIVMLGVILLFQLVTLPVEFDASRRGLKNLNSYHILSKDEQEGARKVLFAAALTYVAGLITTVFEVFRIILIFLGDRD
jgi:Zn-dependent membrane protease YugP